MIAQPPIRRVWGAIRLDFPVASIADSRKLARALGGDIDDAPPAWADPNANFFFGHDPEGNQFGVSQRKGSASGRRRSSGRASARDSKRRGRCRATASSCFARERVFAVSPSSAYAHSDCDRIVGDLCRTRMQRGPRADQSRLIPGGARERLRALGRCARAAAGFRRAIRSMLVAMAANADRRRFADGPGARCRENIESVDKLGFFKLRPATIDAIMIAVPCCPF